MDKNDFIINFKLYNQDEIYNEPDKSEINSLLLRLKNFIQYIDDSKNHAYIDFNIDLANDSIDRMINILRGMKYEKYE